MLHGKRRIVMSIEKREYEKEIEEIARDALEAERDGYNAEDYAWESVDGHQWVIYTYYAKQIPALASSDGSSTLDNMDLNAIYRDSGLGGLFSAIAFACMLDDVQERIAALREEAE